ncbi:PAS domain-containing protein [Rhodovibrio salinarum]|uniref:PAS domain-containing protein n=1 Tax=Rhodovibrio salinarum TaxID=1087 RepID=A0A934QI61_9PROT|nr:PAS domain-containing protein [Rhodovibrio salinarum]MBK1697157.1 PAS domain-containing protein [Rhodovibrio salinarum]
MNVYRPDERRLVLRLLAYWDDLRGERDYPRADDIDAAQVGDDWAQCFLLRLADGQAGASQLLHVGDGFLAELPDGVPATLKEVPESALLHHAAGFIDLTLEKLVPVSLGGDAMLDAGRTLFRSVLLPLSNDGTTIDHLLGAANGRLLGADTVTEVDEGAQA